MQCTVLKKLMKLYVIAEFLLCKMPSVTTFV